MFEGSGETDRLAQVAWLYHVGGLSQEEVSQTLGVSRFKILRMLAEARERGIVRVSIQHETTTTLALADTLRAAWGLTEVMVAPMPEGMPDGPQGSAFARQSVGIVAARFLVRVGGGGARLTIGMGWGWTLAAMAQAVTGLTNSDLRFVSLMGSMVHTSESSPFDVCTNLAALTNGTAQFMPAPFIADDEASCRVILSQRMVRETLEVARQADYAIVSVGECAPGALLYDSNVLTAADQASLAAAGAVADTTGRFFCEDGSLADVDLNRRAPAISFEDLCRRDVVLLAAGIEKLRAVRAVLRAGMVKRLIIDKRLARKLAGIAT